MDVTRNIKAIEALKCALLHDISTLYENMRKPVPPDDRDEGIAEMLIHLYLLARRLGLDYERLDALAIQQIRRSAPEKDGPSERQALLKHLNGGTL